MAVQLSTIQTTNPIQEEDTGGTRLILWVSITLRLSKPAERYAWNDS